MADEKVLEALDAMGEALVGHNHVWSPELRSLYETAVYQAKGTSMPRSDIPQEGAYGEPILKFFEYKHLPPHLQAVSVHFYELAHKLMDLPRNAERTVALRKLLEAKDAAVRTLL
jgi:hypothetical protein